MASSSAPASDELPDDAGDARGRVVRAVYDGEVLRPAEPLGLPPGTPVRIVVSPAIPEAAAAERPPPARGWASRPLAWLAPSRAEGAARLTRAELALLAAGLAFYALTRLVGLAAFPIYFFCDEAIQTTLARELLDSGLRDVNGVLLPPYFRNAEKWNLSLSVYIHALSVALFGQSVALTRGTSVAVSILGVAAVALTLRLVFRSGSWWVAPFALAAMPAWFLHSRTAFETTMMVSFYACFLCCYLLYRTRGPRWLLPALVFGAMTFYSYANGQGVMLVSGVLLLLCDLPYHLRQGWRVWALGAGALALLAVPLLRFRLLQPDAYAEQLRLLGSSWVSPLPLAAKLGTFGANYLQGLSPTYWFLYNTVDLERHRMRGMGHLGLWLAPFVLLGLVVCLRRLASPAHRAVLVAVLAAPFSAALVAIAITRTLAMVVPAAILAVLGLDQVAAWAGPRLRQRWVAAAAAAALAVICLTVTRAALVEGPTWFSDYGMGGMQYGARQLFAESIPEELARSPGTTLLVSPTWANNPNVFLPFFLTPAQSERVQLINIDAFTTSKLELDPARQLFVMPQDEYARANESGKFVLQPPERIISYPDGRPGFYFVRMAYVPNIDELFAADRAARARLVEDEATIGGQAARVAHSLLDMGQVANLFDGDPKTLARGAEANPFVLQLSFAEPRALSGVTLTTASMNFELTMRATPVDGEDAVAGATFVDLPPDPTVRLDLPGGPRQVRELRLEIHQLNVPEVAHVHVRELELR